MKNIPYTANEISVTQQLAPVLHSSWWEHYAISPGLPINFKVHLFPDKRYRHYPHSGSGTLTVPSLEIGRTLLEHFSGLIKVDGRSIVLQPGKKPPRADILGEIQLMPYRDPIAILEKEERLATFNGDIPLQDVQFTWLCRDDSLSIEWQWSDKTVMYSNEPPMFRLLFHEETREIFIRRSETLHETTISIRYSRVQAVETDSRTKTIVLMLETPPSFEREVRNLLPSQLLLLNGKKPQRHKLTHLNPEHAAVAPFTWAVLRLVCDSLASLSEFKRMADLANLPVQDRYRPAENRHLFSTDIQFRLQQWLCSLPWLVAFQCEALHRAMLLDTAELLSLCDDINELVHSTRGSQHATQVLRQFGLNLKEIWYHEEETTVQACFADSMMEVDRGGPDLQETSIDKGLFQCLHVNFTPTGMKLRGPFPDVSNRILRRHPHNQDSFLRVSFTDEDGLHFRFDRREVDGPRFIEERVGTILKKGFDLCGRQ